MFTLVIVSDYREAPSIYNCSTLSFAKTLASPQYGEVCYIYEDNGAGKMTLIETLKPKEY